ncbi:MULTISPECIES: ribonuclease H1 domain-containing protein [Tissierellales]|jgi:ribonuclease HI|uniref:Ribonuclease H n=1 Tax=Acidilutibacter cellobiosedens TaxID=2507161 RepID=A0A410QFE6_9FIRM|nr:MULTISPECIES: ribonuclease H family protein [Tissierellales]MBE6083110.1 reverse transcriptase-like protein [Tissierellaceae bacterium]QAT62802.1 reverse transcriptase-like protein [Acidilutibacter cellobiosedens]SCL93287.1 Ribonuclease H [Sporanaerobacter sp. PP17-6a]
MKKKYYAVKKGINIGIYNSWGKCEEQVKGYPQAEYKSFLTLKEAEDYLNGIENEGIVRRDKKVEDLEDGEMIAYVDGSFDKESGYYGYGAVLITKKGKEVYKGRDNKKEKSDMRNVAGEIDGSMTAMKIALERNIRTLYLYYDYAGIEKWCTEEWKRNKTETKEYNKYYNSIKDKLKVIFIKVRAHSGNKYNEEADGLAKSALKNND